MRNATATPPPGWGRRGRNSDEYEAQLRRLNGDIESTYTTLQCARQQWDRLCEERLELNWQWRKQQGVEQ
ncbi:hypothetical protein ABT255_01995 [Streptomyces mirabilis]|uniref:hypothetical protein n=1 Tax=Streptomyces mirabilis TaxID=68239 RepID=UPI00332834AD